MSSTQKKWTVGIAVFLSLVLFFALVFDLNWFKGFIERKVTKETGREFKIGDLSLKPWPLRIHMEDIRFANTTWARKKEMLRAQEAEFRIDLVRLLNGTVVFPEISVERPYVNLELGPRGEKNWLLGKDKDDAKAPEIGRLTVNKGVLTFYDPRQKTDIKLEVATVPIAKGKREGVRFKATGK